LLVRHDPRAKNFFFRGVNRALGWFTDRYKRLLGVAIRHRVILAVLFVGGLVATGFVYTRVPTAFVPDEDQGYIIVNVQGPPGASVQVTLATTLQIEKLLMAQPEVEGVFNVVGFSFTGTGSNKATLFCALRPMAERKGSAHSAMTLIERVRGPLFGITGALVFAFLPPSVQGIGRFGGFQYELEDRAGGDIGSLAGATFAMMGAANRDQRMRGVFSGFTANDPQLVVDIDREKAKSLDVPFSQISDTLQVYMGSVYVNDFDFNNRSYRVYAQSDREFRSTPKDIRQFYVRSNRGQMLPLDAVVRIRQVEAPQTISHFNLFRAAEINGSAAPGVSSGDALIAMDEVSKQVLPQGYAYEWSGISLEQIESGSQALLIFFLGVLVVYLVLSAQYESFALPFIIMLAVPLAIFGALGLVALRGQANDVFCQIGLVMLVGLASKNGIL